MNDPLLQYVHIEVKAEFQNDHSHHVRKNKPNKHRQTNNFIKKKKEFFLGLSTSVRLRYGLGPEVAAVGRASHFG